MGALVEPPGLEVEAEQRITSRLSARCAAFGNGPARRDHASLAWRSRTAPNQRRQPATAGRRRRGRPRRWSCRARTGPSARRTAPGRVASARCLASSRARREHLAQVDEKAGPVARLSLRAPGVLAARGGERLRLDQRGRQRVRADASCAGSRAGWRAAASSSGSCSARASSPPRRGSVRRRCSSASISASACGARLVALGRHHRRPVPAGDRVAGGRSGAAATSAAASSS